MQLYSNRSIQVSIIYICDGADANMLICYGLWPWGHTLGWVAFEKKSRMVEFENLALSIHFVLSLKLGAGCLSYPCLTLSLPTWSSICMPIWLHFSQVVPFFLPYSPCCHFMWVRCQLPFHITKWPKTPCLVERGLFKILPINFKLELYLLFIRSVDTRVILKASSMWWCWSWIGMN